MKARNTVSAKASGVPKSLGTIVCLSLCVVTLLVYFQTFYYGFVYYDDQAYVYENPMLKAGISMKGLSWAFTSFYMTNWHPLTWISYLLINQFFGIDAGVEHVVNTLLHMGAVALLFFALLEMTQKPWRCAVVAGIFALHPMHVESVAWVAERKDVLSTFFEMLTLLLYVRYARTLSSKRYVLVMAAFLLSLLAKPMAVTFPFVLLLLDVWPLRRSECKRMVLEKVPLIAMSAAASVVTFLAQRSAVSIGIPFSERLANAIVAYVAYLGKIFWPVDLALLYPLRNPSPEAVFGALFLLIGISGAAVLTFRLRPYFLVGWLWYLGMLVPVIGLVQVGKQAMADRYTYLPLVGLSIAIVWTLADAAESSPGLKKAALALALLIFIAMPVLAYRQTGFWKDSETLFRHALAVTGDNPTMENDLGMIVQRDGRNAEAEALYRKSAAGAPWDDGVQTNLGVLLAAKGLAEISEASRINDRALAATGEKLLEEAKTHIAEAVRLNPVNAESQGDLCFVLQRMGQVDQAIAACEAALRVKPEATDARFNLGTALASQGKSDAAAAHFSRVLEIDPKYSAARAALDGLGRGK